jgi:hypothetical protein
VIIWRHIYPDHARRMAAIAHATRAAFDTPGALRELRLV